MLKTCLLIIFIVSALYQTAVSIKLPEPGPIITFDFQTGFRGDSITFEVNNCIVFKERCLTTIDELGYANLSIEGYQINDMKLNFGSITIGKSVQ